MRKAVLLVFLLLLTGLPNVLAQAAPDKGGESGVFLMYFRGELVGEEHFTIVPQPGSQILVDMECRINLPKGGNHRETFLYKTSLLCSQDYEPIKYDQSFWVNGRESFLNVRFDGKRATDVANMGGINLNRSCDLVSPLIVLEETLYTNYQIMARKYSFNRIDTSKGGELLMNLYIPKIAKIIPGKLHFQDAGTLDTKFGPKVVKRFFLDEGGFQGISLSIDETGKVLKIEIPRQELVVLRDLNADAQQVGASPQTAAPGPGNDAPAVSPAPPTAEKK